MENGALGLSKAYGGVPAIEDVHISIEPGEVRALLGQNGAGKSTVIGCIGGRVAPDAGAVVVRGVEHASLSPKEARDAGVAVIYQHLSLIGSLTVADNVFLGEEATSRGLLDRRRQRQVTSELLEQVGAAFGPDDVVDDLTIGQQQLVEIAKALRKDARLLILDEPTAALSRRDAEALGKHVRGLKDTGMAILYVTHLLNEVERLADTVTVMRNGRVVLDDVVANAPRETLIAAITGGTGSRTQDQRVSNPTTPVRLEIEQLQAERLGPIDLNVHQGEIVGIIGLMGAGRSRFLETLAGARGGDWTGTVLVDGEHTHHGSAAGGIRGGMALVPADRLKQGLFRDLRALDNTVIRVGTKLARGLLRRFGSEHELFDRTASDLVLRPARADLPVHAFSGGNQQKLLLSRWLNPISGVRVLLLDDPTQGVDVGARAEIYEVVRRLAHERDLAVVFSTSDPEELLALADRAYLFADGAITRHFDLNMENEDTLAFAVQSAQPAHT